MGYSQSRPLDEREQQALQRSRDLIRFGRLRHWDSRTSNAIVPSVLSFSEFRHAIGMSDEQYQQIRDKMHITSIELLRKQQEEIEAIYERAGVKPPPFGPLPREEAFSAEDKKQFQDIQERSKWEGEIAFSDVIGDALTHEQHQKINEALLANMGQVMMPVISPSRFEGLNLTDAQREKMRIFEKEIEPKFEIFLDNYIDSQMAFDNRLHSLIQEQEGETLREKTQAVNKKLADDVEFNKHFAAMLSHEREFTTLVLKEIDERNILTDKQWERIRELCDNPPEHAKILARHVLGTDANKANEVGENSKDNTESGGNSVWQPGPGSWKPGDAIPEQYRQDRNERNRFPRGAE